MESLKKNKLGSQTVASKLNRYFQMFWSGFFSPNILQFQSAKWAQYHI